MATPGTSDLLNITGNFVKKTGTPITFDALGTNAQGVYKLVDWSGTSGFADADFAATNLGGGNSGTFTVDPGTSAFYLTFVPEPSRGRLSSVALAWSDWLAIAVANFLVNPGHTSPKTAQYISVRDRSCFLRGRAAPSRPLAASGQAQEKIRHRRPQSAQPQLYPHRS